MINVAVVGRPNVGKSSLVNRLLGEERHVVAAQAGTTRDVRFDKPGVSYIFCNIHPEMSAVVIAVQTPYYATSDARGDITIRDVPAGRYNLHIWYEAALAETLNSMTREITVSEESLALGVLRLARTNVVQSHKNKYGRDYDPPAPDSPAYPHP